MMSFDPNPESTELASNITIQMYRKMVADHNKADIADLVRKRFEERYLRPILDSDIRHGFAMLAICCLMVEALESFRQGWKKTSNGSEAFCGFFHAHEQFTELRVVAHDFYRAVRCGILHQAETTEGWRVSRDEADWLLKEDGATRWLNAREFGRRLRTILQVYCQALETSDWDESRIWVKPAANFGAFVETAALLTWLALPEHGHSKFKHMFPLRESGC
jgi:hypothetical protein